MKYNKELKKYQKPNIRIHGDINKITRADYSGLKEDDDHFNES